MPSSDDNDAGKAKDTAPKDEKAASKEKQDGVKESGKTGDNANHAPHESKDDKGKSEQVPKNNGKSTDDKHDKDKSTAESKGDDKHGDKDKTAEAKKDSKTPERPEKKSDDKAAHDKDNSPADKAAPGAEPKAAAAPGAPGGAAGSGHHLRPTIAILLADTQEPPESPEPQASDADLLKSALQRARRQSIRAKSRGSIVSQSLLAQPSGRIRRASVEDQIEADNVWDLAVKMKRVDDELTDPEDGQLETTLLVLGGKQAGKSTLVGCIMEREEAARRTLGLDYTYARRAGKGVSKDVCQIWELGGGTAFLSLLDTPVSAQRLSDTACVIVVDLTRPETILPTVDVITKYLRELIDTKLTEAGTTGVLVRNLLTSQLQARRPEGQPDSDAVQPLLIPLAVVGSMYDKFQPMDTVDKKVVVEAARWAAHRSFATLLFFSIKDVALQNRARDLLTHLAFHTPLSEHRSLDVQKPIQVAAGADSFKAIAGGGDGVLPYEVVLAHVSDKWPPQKEQTGVPDDPAKDEVFAEPEVDSLRAEKAKELDRLRQDLERRRKMASERAAAEKLKRAAPAPVPREEAQQAAAEYLERHHSALGNAKADAAKKPAAKDAAKKTADGAAKEHRKTTEATKKADDSDKSPKKSAGEAHPRSAADAADDAHDKKQPSAAQAHPKAASDAADKPHDKKPAKSGEAHAKAAPHAADKHGDRKQASSGEAHSKPDSDAGDKSKDKKQASSREAHSKPTSDARDKVKGKKQPAVDTSHKADASREKHKEKTK